MRAEERGDEERERGRKKERMIEWQDGRVHPTAVPKHGGKRQSLFEWLRWTGPTEKYHVM